MLCPSCGQYDATGSVDCPACGERIREGDSPGDQKLRCPVCGGPNVAGECPDCGEILPKQIDDEADGWKWSLRRSLAWDAVIIVVLIAAVAIIRLIPVDLQVVVVTLAMYGMMFLLAVGFTLMMIGFAFAFGGEDWRIGTPLSRRLITCGAILSAIAFLLGMAAGLLANFGVEPEF